MAFTLFNKLIGKKLVHPKVGLWYTNDLGEAAEMYAACLEYLAAEGLPEIIPNICVIDAETEEEVNLLEAGIGPACRSTSTS